MSSLLEYILMHFPLPINQKVQIEIFVIDANFLVTFKFSDWKNKKILSFLIYDIYVVCRTRPAPSCVK